MALPYRLIRTQDGVGGRQMFTDNWLIQNDGGFVRSWKEPTFFGSAIQTYQTWETKDYTPAGGQDPSGTDDRYFLPFSGRIIWDGAKFRCYYYGGKFVTCVAYSNDLITWTKPNLGLFGATNIVFDWSILYPTTGHDSDSVIYDPDDPDANRRWKMATTVLIPGVSWHQDLLVSADGLSWTKVGQTGQIIDRTTVDYSRLLKKYIWYVRDFQGPPSNPRYGRYWESRLFDSGLWVSLQNYFIPQTRAQPVMWMRMQDDDDNQRHDSQDPANDIDAGGTIVNGLSIPTYQYHCCWSDAESQRFGQRAKLELNPNYTGRPKIEALQRCYTRNGFHYGVAEPDKTTPWIRCSTTPQAWDWGNKQGIFPSVFLDQGTWKHPVSGRAGIPGVGLESGDCSMGIYETRREGHCSMQSTGDEKTLTTRKLRWLSGSQFIVNSKPIGASPRLRVEIVDGATGDVIPGFARTDSSEVTTDQTGIQVTFGGGANVSGLVGRVVRAKFVARETELYSFGIGNGSGDCGGSIALGRP